MSIFLLTSRLIRQRAHSHTLVERVNWFFYFVWLQFSISSINLNLMFILFLSFLFFYITIFFQSFTAPFQASICMCNCYSSPLTFLPFPVFMYASIFFWFTSKNHQYVKIHTRWSEDAMHMYVHTDACIGGYVNTL